MNLYSKLKNDPELLERSNEFSIEQKSTFENRDFQNSFDAEHVFSHELKTCALFMSNFTPADLKCDIENLIDFSRYSSVSKLYRVTA